MYKVTPYSLVNNNKTGNDLYGYQYSTGYINHSTSLQHNARHPFKKDTVLTLKDFQEI